jgi:hypothetical protein
MLGAAKKKKKKKKIEEIGRRVEEQIKNTYRRWEPKWACLRFGTVNRKKQFIQINQHTK